MPFAVILIALAAHQSLQVPSSPPSSSPSNQPNLPAICTEHSTTSPIAAVAENASSSFSATYSIQNQAGDATVSILTNEPIALRSINLAGLNAALAAWNVTLGVRILHVQPQPGESVRDLLLLEVQYLQQCTATPVAILVLHELWPLVAEIAADIEYDIWRLPPAARLLFPKVAHLLYELPWGERNDDEEGDVDTTKRRRRPLVGVQAADLQVEEAFLSAARAEHLCLKTMMQGTAAEADDVGMQIALGRAILYVTNMQPEDESVVVGKTLLAQQQTTTLFAVPLVAEDYAFIASELIFSRFPTVSIFSILCFFMF